MQSEKLSQFIETLYNIQKQEENIDLSDQKLKELALSAGFTLADWEYFDREFNSILQKARNFFEIEDYSRAAIEIEKALKIKPTNAEALEIAAKTFFELCKEKRTPERVDKAEAYTLELIRQQPQNTEAYKILKKIAQYREKQKRKKTILIASAIAIIIIAITGYLYLPNGKTELQTTTTITQKVNIPVTIKNPDFSQYFDIELDTLITHNYGKSYTVNIFGYLKIKDQEAQRIKMVFKILDKEGQIIDQSTKILWDCDFWLYKNDIIPFYDLSYQSGTSLSDVGKVVIEVIDCKIRKGQPHKKPQEVKTRICQDCKWNIGVKIRDKQIIIDNNKQQAYFKGVLIFENNNDKPVNRLKYRIILYDKTGEPLASSDYYAVIEDEPDIKPNSYYLDTVFKTLSIDKAKRFSYAVIEILEIS